MLRLLIALVLVFVAVWFLLKDGQEGNKAALKQAENIDVAEDAVRATEDASAAMAAQADAARDAANAALSQEGAADEGGQADAP